MAKSIQGGDDSIKQFSMQPPTQIFSTSYNMVSTFKQTQLHVLFPVQLCSTILTICKVSKALKWEQPRTEGKHSVTLSHTSYVQVTHKSHWDQQLCVRFLIPYQCNCGERFHYSNKEVGKINQSQMIYHALRKMLYFYLAERKFAEACMCFTTRGLIAGVFCKLFQALTDFMRL